MKNLLIILTIVNLASCAHQIPLSYEERCAIKGMKFNGLVNESNGASVSTFSNGDNTVNGYSESYMSSVQCVSPTTAKDRCEIKKKATAATEAQVWNAGVRGKNLLTYMGYVFFILPGVCLQSWYGNQESEHLYSITELRKPASCGDFESNTDKFVNQEQEGDYYINNNKLEEEQKLTAINDYFNKFPKQAKWKTFVDTNTIDIGMNKEVCEMSWGKPASKEITKSSKGKIEKWSYPDKSSMLIFTNNILESYQTN